MHLILALLGPVIRKVVLIVGLVLTLFLGFLLFHALAPSLREAVADRARLEQVTEERIALEAELERLRRASEEGIGAEVENLEDAIDARVKDASSSVADAEKKLEDSRDEESEACGLGRKILDALTPGSTCKAAEALRQKADETLDLAENSLRQAQEAAAVLSDPEMSPEEKLDRLGEGEAQAVIESAIKTKEAELTQKKADETSLEAEQARGLGWVVSQWAKVWKGFLTIAVVIVFVPYVLRIVNYFLLMPLVRRLHNPIHLASGPESVTTKVSHSEAQPTLTVRLGPGEVLAARAQYVRPVQGRTQSLPLYAWAAPFISYAAGLHDLTQVSGAESITVATLAPPDDPSLYLMRIDFQDHPGLVMQARHIVGVVGAPELVTRWRWGIHALVTWQVRYVLFTGTGSLIVQGQGNVDAENPEGGSMRMDQHLVMGFDSRLRVGVHRTEAFWQYLRGKVPLVTDEFTGHQPFFWQKSNTSGSSNPIEKVFGAFYSAVGKVFGF